jgi:hypothetical protein
MHLRYLAKDFSHPLAAIWINVDSKIGLQIFEGPTQFPWLEYLVNIQDYFFIAYSGACNEPNNREGIVPILVLKHVHMINRSQSSISPPSPQSRTKVVE